MEIPSNSSDAPVMHDDRDEHETTINQMKSGIDIEEEDNDNSGGAERRGQVNPRQSSFGRSEP